MKAIIRIGVPEYQIGQEVSCYFKDTMNVKGICEAERTGHWIEKEDFNGDTYYDCSECGESFCLIDGTPTDNLYNYCPNCGYKMQESEEMNGKNEF